MTGQQSTPTSAVPNTPGLPMPGHNLTAGQTNNLAVVSLIAGIASFFAHIIPVIGGFTVAIIAIVTGFMARRQIKQSGEQGMWMANVGIAIGILHFAIAFLIVLAILFLIFVAGIALFGISTHGGGSMPSPVVSG